MLKAAGIVAVVIANAVHLHYPRAKAGDARRQNMCCRKSAFVFVGARARVACRSPREKLKLWGPYLFIRAEVRKIRELVTNGEIGDFLSTILAWLGALHAGY